MLKGNCVIYFVGNTMTKIRFSWLLYFSMIMIVCVFHMVSSKGDTGGNERKVKKIFKLDHEYLGKGLVPSRVMESPLIDNYGLPGMLHEMTIEIHGGNFQCFYQSLQKGAKFFLYFQVTRGADKNIDLEVIRPDGISLTSFQWTDQGRHDDEVPIDGVYAMCLDNRLSKYSSKIIHVYMNSFFDTDWEKYVQDYQDSVSSLANFSNSFQHIDLKIKEMLTLITWDGQVIIKDWYLIKDNNAYVLYLSVFMCVLIVVTSGLQVIFVRRLFASSSSSKPRI